MIKRTIYLFVSISVISFAACKIPQMKLHNKTMLKSTYKTIGSLAIGNFEDKRPKEEKQKEKTAVNSLDPQIWSGNTDPEMLLFFKDKLSLLARQSKIFTKDGKNAFTISGIIYSMKTDRKVSGARYCMPIVDFPDLTATIHFKAIVKKGDSVVFEKTIKHSVTEDYWAMREWTWTQVSGWSSELLDKTMTQAIKKLFDELSKKAKAGELVVQK